jgi:glycosyltransferase involved in cell wall biosynthesis
MSGVVSRKGVREAVAAIGSAEIVIGIPSFNNARTIGHVVQAVEAGLAKYFPERTSVLVNSDGGSTDGTTEVVRSASVDEARPLLLRHRIEPLRRIVTPYTGISGKGSAFRAIFEIATSLGARACAVVDSDLRSITPEWIELLVRPVIDGEVEFVAPLYQRHKYDGTITNSIIYPLTRALYGKRLRQPIGGDFGVSGRLAESYLEKDVWETDVARYGIDIWMTTEAIAGGFPVGQSFLGAKIHDPKDPGSDLSAMLSQVVGSAFGLMAEHEKQWLGVTGSSDVPTFGFHYAVGTEAVDVNVARMMSLFRAGLRDLGEIWGTILGHGDLSELRNAGGAADDEFRFPKSLWTRIIYDFALAYRKRRLPGDQLIRSLTPLYLGKTASFVMEASGMGADEAEAEIEALCLDFEQGKDYLVGNWR